MKKVVEMPTAIASALDCEKESILPLLLRLLRSSLSGE